LGAPLAAGGGDGVSVGDDDALSGLELLAWSEAIRFPERLDRDVIALRNLGERMARPDHVGGFGVRQRGAGQTESGREQGGKQRPGACGAFGGAHLQHAIRGLENRTISPMWSA
jgi:hypothetical protein